jgi:YD repeat-containing protein
LRGNPTLLQRWTGGSYLSTTYTYDTTGQVISSADPAGNLTQLNYTDNYYSDNGGNPPAPYTPSLPTNAFITQITLPVSGATSYGYYYGSGRRAYLRDQNNQTTYYSEH